MRTVIRQIHKYENSLIKSIFLKAHGRFHSASKRFFMNRSNILLIAFHKNIPCGFLYAYLLDSLNSNHPKMFLYSIDVFDDYKRTGIGTLLVNHLKRISKKHNCSEIFVLTNKSNAAAMKFYASTNGKRENTDDVMFVYSPVSGQSSYRRNGT